MNTKYQIRQIPVFDVSHHCEKDVPFVYKLVDKREHKLGYINKDESGKHHFNKLPFTSLSVEDQMEIDWLLYNID